MDECKELGELFCLSLLYSICLLIIHRRALVLSGSPEGFSGDLLYVGGNNVGEGGCGIKEEKAEANIV